MANQGTKKSLIWKSQVVNLKISMYCDAGLLEQRGELELFELQSVSSRRCSPIGRLKGPLPQLKTICKIILDPKSKLQRLRVSYLRRFRHSRLPDYWNKAPMGFFQWGESVCLFVSPRSCGVVVRAHEDSERADSQSQDEVAGLELQTGLLMVTLPRSCSLFVDVRHSLFVRPSV